jgi:hypothetical protein
MPSSVASWLGEFVETGVVPLTEEQQQQQQQEEEEEVCSHQAAT